MASNFNSLISEQSLNNQSSIRERDKNDTCDNDDIIIRELTVGEWNQWSKSGSETWRCVFSDDEQSLLACTFGQILLLAPKDVYLNKNAPNTGLTINCGDLVRSLLFLKIKDVEALSNNFWPKSAKCKQLFLVTGHHGKIRIWDTLEGKLLLQLNDHKSIVTDLATNPGYNNLLISSSHDGTVKIRDLLNEGDSLIKTLSPDGQQIENVKVSPNGKLLVAAGSSRTIYIWNTDNFELVDKLIGHRHRISSISWSPDSKRLASVSFDSTCMLWNVTNGQKIAQYNHLNPEPSYIFASGDNGYFCRSVCFAPDNHHLCTVCDDNCDSKVRVWNIQNNGEPIKSFKIIDAISCQYSPSGNFFVVGTKNGSVFILKTPKSVNSLLSLCRTEISKRNLYKEPMNNQRTLPKELVDYLNYLNL